MKLIPAIFITIFLFVSTSFAQTVPVTFEKECRLAGGGGFANGISNATGGPDIWLQMSYGLSKKFSVATEFENMYYKRPGYFQSVPPNGVNVRKIYDNYISFLIKYHLPIQSKLYVNAVSGWTYRIEQEVYDYEQHSSNGSSYITSQRDAYSNYGIPFIVEANYPIGKVFQMGVRGKYNLNANGTDATYSTGLTLSLKL